MISLGQVHEDKIVRIDPDHLNTIQGDIPQTDALISREKNVVLTVRTADCVPVFLFDPLTPSIGLVHAGWRGARLGIVQKTVGEMASQFQASPENMKVILGPSIRSCCYEFDRNLVPEFSSFMKPKGERFCFDLPGYLVGELIRCGVPGPSIFDTELCTSCHPEDFFSYRRQPDSSGRMLSFIMLK